MKIRTIFLSLAFAAIATHVDAQVEIHHFDCRANGVSARMVMHVERFNTHGYTFGAPAPNPVISDGGQTMWLEGTVTGTQGSYSFSGWAPYAGFRGRNGGSFQVNFVLDERKNGVWAIVNPFHGASEQVRYWCQKIE